MEPSVTAPDPEGAIVAQNEPGPVTRSAIAALMGSLRDGERWPRWVTHPATETEFYASLMVHCPYVTPIYDGDELVWLRGIRLKETANCG